MAREQNYFEKVVRPWGYFVNIAYGENYLTKIIHVNLNGQLSLQSHNHRSEHWFVLKGNAKVKVFSKKMCNFVAEICKLHAAIRFISDIILC